MYVCMYLGMYMYMYVRTQLTPRQEGYAQQKRGVCLCVCMKCNVM